MKSLRRIIWLLALLPLSCAKDSAADKSAGSATPATHKPLSERLAQKNGYKQDAQGNWIPQNDQRSSFETKGESPYFKGKYDKKAYQTGTYSKKSWWGNKEYGRKEYADNTDGSRFQTTSRFNKQGAREAATSADVPDPYQTGTYATNAAHEAGRSDIKKTSDTETDNRRKVYQSPEIIDWREQRALSVEQSKGILGH